MLTSNHAHINNVLQNNIQKIYREGRKSFLLQDVIKKKLLLMIFLIMYIFLPFLNF